MADWPQKPGMKAESVEEPQGVSDEVHPLRAQQVEVALRRKYFPYYLVAAQDCQVWHPHPPQRPFSPYQLQEDARRPRASGLVQKSCLHWPERCQLVWEGSVWEATSAPGSSAAHPYLPTEWCQSAQSSPQWQPPG